MNRIELAEELMNRNPKDFPNKRMAERTVSSLCEIIQETVASGEKVVISGFCTFEKVQRAGRIGRNPRTGETVKIAEKSAPKITAGSKFKKACL